MDNTITIVIADDHPVFRTGLLQILERAPGMTVVATSGDGVSALASIREHRPQVAVLDVQMPEMSGMEVARAVEDEKLPSAILILTMFDDDYLFDTAMEYGVLGYILKDSASQDIVRGIRTVAEGRYYISPALADGVMRKSTTPPVPNKQAQLQQLTPTEKRILHLIAENYMSSRIGKELNISTRTVDRHRENISRKLQLSGPYALLRFALQQRAHL